MKITIKEYTLTISDTEAWDITRALKKDLEQSVREHWINFSREKFLENTKRERYLLKSLCLRVGSPHYDNAICSINKIFDEREKKNE